MSTAPAWKAGCQSDPSRFSLHVRVKPGPHDAGQDAHPIEVGTKSRPRDSRSSNPDSDLPTRVIPGDDHAVAVDWPSALAGRSPQPCRHRRARRADSRSGKPRVNLRGTFDLVELRSGGPEVVGRWAPAWSTSRNALTSSRRVVDDALHDSETVNQEEESMGLFKNAKQSAQNAMSAASGGAMPDMGNLSLIHI